MLWQLREVSAEKALLELQMRAKEEELEALRLELASSRSTYRELQEHFFVSISRFPLPKEQKIYISDSVVTDFSEHI